MCYAMLENLLKAVPYNLLTVVVSLAISLSWTFIKSYFSGSFLQAMAHLSYRSRWIGLIVLTHCVASGYIFYRLY